MMKSTTTAAAIAAIEKISAQAIQAILTAATTAAETTAATAAEAGNKSHLDHFLDSWSKAPTAGELVKEMIDQAPCEPMNDPTAIVVVDDDDNIIATESTTATEEATETIGDLPHPIEAAAPAETATTTYATATDEATVETAATEDAETATTETVNGITTARQDVAATTADLSNIYEIIKYTLRHEGVNSSIDKSVYAPTRNMYVAFNNGRYKMYLSLHNNELVVMLMKNDNNNENVIMKMKATLSSVEVVTVDDEMDALASNARINTVIDIISSAIDLICK